MSWIKVVDRLPLSGVEDDKYTPPFYEKEFKVIVNGAETTANFWACWEVSYDCVRSEFIMEFDVEGVTHWLDDRN